MSLSFLIFISFFASFDRADAQFSPCNPRVTNCTGLPAPMFRLQNQIVPLKKALEHELSELERQESFLRELDVALQSGDHQAFWQKETMDRLHSRYSNRIQELERQILSLTETLAPLEAEYDRLNQQRLAERLERQVQKKQEELVELERRSNEVRESIGAMRTQAQ